MTAVIVALISAFAVIAAAVISYFSQRTKQVQSTIGKKNGHGTLMAMSAEILGLVRDHSRRLQVLEDDLAEKTRLINRLAGDHADMRALIEESLPTSAE